MRETYRSISRMRTLTDSLLDLADRYSEARGWSLKTIARKAANDAKFFARIADGKGVTTRRYEHVMLWMSENWPVGCEWPADLDRPSAKADAA